MEGQGRKEEQDGVGDRDREPAQESEVGAPGTSRKEGVGAFHQPVCAPGKTKSTSGEWRPEPRAVSNADPSVTVQSTTSP